MWFIIQLPPSSSMEAQLKVPLVLRSYNFLWILSQADLLNGGESISPASFVSGTTYVGNFNPSSMATVLDAVSLRLTSGVLCFCSFVAEGRSLNPILVGLFHVP